MLYLYPNRPVLLPPDPKSPLDPGREFIDSLEASGKYVAGKKFNGDNVLINTDQPDVFWNRKKERLKRYKPIPEMVAELKKWPASSLINAELMHLHGTLLKDTIIVHCIYVWKGHMLVGKTWQDSRDILETMQSGTHVQIETIHSSGFWDLFQAADGKNVEGIVLKEPAGKLVISTMPIPDVPWMKKIRKPNKMYNF